MALKDFKDGTYGEEPEVEEREWNCTGNIQVDIDPTNTHDFPPSITIAGRKFQVRYMNATLGLKFTINAVTREEAFSKLEQKLKEVKQEIEEDTQQTGIRNSYMYIEGDDMIVEPQGEGELWD